MSDSPSKRPPRIPPYRLVAAELAAEIRAGRYDSGEPFPSESALSKRFGVAIMTVRRALEVLREEWGLITTRWGKGSAVVPPENRPASDMAEPRPGEPGRGRFEG
ncbi:GntR family transcriptional regulator [Kitasatospora sp. NPDC048298]|uniref:GntR family transcriptional regulator n=1 Tax=Kitasatospora sp. NPDC048298 TaxID=3364049 RepID=UPI003716ADEC